MTCSPSAAVDVIVTAAVACLFSLREGSRLGWRWTAVLVPLTFVVALAFTFPLSLALRELRLRAADAPRPPPTPPDQRQPDGLDLTPRTGG